MPASNLARRPGAAAPAAPAKRRGPSPLVAKLKDQVKRANKRARAGASAAKPVEGLVMNAVGAAAMAYAEVEADLPTVGDVRPALLYPAVGAGLAMAFLKGKNRDYALGVMGGALAYGVGQATNARSITRATLDDGGSTTSSGVELVGADDLSEDDDD